MISNITAGSTTQIQAVIDNKLVLPLLEVLKDDDIQTKMEAAWAISNATSGGTREQIMSLVEQGCIKPLCDLLYSHDIRIIELVLDALGNMLKAGKDSTSNGNNAVACLIEEVGGPGQDLRTPAARELRHLQEVIRHDNKVLLQGDPSSLKRAGKTLRPPVSSNPPP